MPSRVGGVRSRWQRICEFLLRCLVCVCDTAKSYDYHFFKVASKVAKNMHENQIAVLQVRP
jgi:hypothetical protein